MSEIIEHIRNSGLSNEALAKKADIKLERIASIIDGFVEPNMSEVRKISKALKLPIDFLVSASDKFEEINVLFRQAVKGDREKQKADNISYLIGNALSILKGVQMEHSFLKNFPTLSNTHTNARALATRFRELYCGGDFYTPLLHLPSIVSEELNCILFIFDLGNDIDGASAIIQNIPFIFISPRFQPRMLFTLAHELAHIVTHHNSGNYAKVDKNISLVGRNQFKDEAFANAFASELLMPEEAIGVALRQIRRLHSNTGAIGDIEILYISRIFGVSFDVAAKRCEDIDLLPRGGGVSLSEKVKKEFGSAEKRADSLDIPERPKIVFPKVSSILVEAAVEKIKDGEMSIGKASEILGVPMNELMIQNTRK